MVRITALMDNQHSEHKALAAEHGLSYLLERDGRRILFDCGSGDGAWRNARRLGRDVVHIDAVVISHSHYDHAAGYRDLVEQGGGGRLLCTGPRFFEPKFAADGPRRTDLSPGFDEDFLAEHGITHRTVEGTVELFPGVYLLSGFPRLHDFETIPSRFVRRTAEGFVPDDFGDEVCLAFVQEGALQVLVGCSHPGILNMMTHVHAALGLPIRALYGGTHLGEADEGRIRRTVAALAELGLETAGLGHCSGEQAEAAVAAQPGLRSCHMAAGDCIFFD